MIIPISMKSKEILGQIVVLEQNQTRDLNLKNSDFPGYFNRTAILVPLSTVEMLPLTSLGHRRTYTFSELLLGKCDSAGVKQDDISHFVNACLHKILK